MRQKRFRDIAMWLCVANVVAWQWSLAAGGATLMIIFLIRSYHERV